MSVQSEIDRIKSNVAGAYAAVSDMGGTLPVQQNSKNLADAVRSIPPDGASLQSISVTTPPAKTLYLSGDVFDPSGMIVTATFSDGTVISAFGTSLPFSPSGPLAETDTQITVTMTFGDATKTAVQPISITASQVFGVVWDSSARSAELTRLTAENDPNGFVNTDITIGPAPAVGNGVGSSPFDNYAPWSGMEEYNIINSVVAYKRGDDGFSRSNYDTMVYIPEYWYKVVQDGDNRYFYVSNREKDGFEKHPGSGKYVGRYNTGSGYVSKTGMAPLTMITRSTVREGLSKKGSKWCLYDFMSWCAVWLLFLVEFASWNSQAKVGRGYVDDNTGPIPSGGTDSMAYHTGRAAGTNGKTAVQYRHIENLWGNLFEWIDGINFNNHAAYIGLDRTKYSDDDPITNYTDAGVTISTNGWMKGLGISNTFPWAFLPSQGGGSADAFITDYIFISDGLRIPFVGGRWDGNSYAGLFYINATGNKTSTGKDLGTRSLYNP